MTLHRAVNRNLGTPDQSAENSLASILIVSLNFTSAGMDLSLVLVLAIVADLLILKIIPARRRVAQFVSRGDLLSRRDS